MPPFTLPTIPPAEGDAAGANKPEAIEYAPSAELAALKYPAVIAFEALARSSLAVFS